MFLHNSSLQIRLHLQRNYFQREHSNTALLFRIRSRNRLKALGDKLILLLTRIGRLLFLQGLSPGNTLPSARLELAHVFTVALNLFLLGIGTA